MAVLNIKNHDRGIIRFRQKMIRTSFGEG